ncbi:hypothetical protein [Shewanella algae]|uniref:hypothetical protein n=1 Tax=Shewanella algae TaxID=38313 RepID=UPI001AAE70B4|nr:hypothetical protein [Shewanella algae]MBO2588815.1 hypothetical protein [Shewanella algae]
MGSKPKEATSTFIEDTGWVKSLCSRDWMNLTKQTGRAILNISTAPSHMGAKDICSSSTA